jgi:dihydroflavonol-4-reductase
MILVTGGTGLVGSHLLYELSSSGRKVRALKRKGSSLNNLEKTFGYYAADPKALLNNIEWVEGDMMDYFSLSDSMIGVEEVFHCAATISFSPKDATLMLKQNTEGTANVVNCCIEHSVKKACFVSSVAALGQTGTDEEITEETFWKNSPENSVYSISKYASEREVWRGIEEGLNAVIVNPAIILGPGNWTAGSSNMFSSAFKGMKYYSNGVSGFVDVRDVVKTMVQLMDKGIFKERFIVSSESVSYRTFFNYMHDCFGRPKPSAYANKFLSELVWRVEKIRSSILHTNPLITKETVRSAHQINRFSNKKVAKALSYRFIPIKKSVEDTCILFMKDIG